MKASPGFDSPIYAANADRLDRTAFAREIVALACAGPREWTARVGVYGEWGSGKTSVLRLSEAMIRRAGHVTVWFSPWGYRTDRAMWNALVSAIVAEVERGGENSGPLRFLPSKMRRLGSRLGSALERVSSSSVAAVARQARAEIDSIGSGVELVSDWLRYGARDLQALDKALGDRRLVLFVDDLDRVDPEVLPNLLLGIREVLELPGLRFVLALDPLVVARSLSTTNPAWGDGQAFLEKIIEFPRRLPPPSREAITRMAVRDAAEHFEFFPEDAIRAISPELPLNPRRVKLFVRYLSVFETVARRYGADEVDHATLLLGAILKAEWPTLVLELAAAEDVLKEMVGLRIARMMYEGREGADPDIVLASSLDSICDRAAIVGDGDRQRAKALVQILSLRTALSTVEALRDHLLLPERPAPVTRKEFRACLPLWRQSPSASTLDDWVTQHSRAIDATKQCVIRGLFEVAVALRAESLSALSSIAIEGAQEHEADIASEYLAIVKCLSLDLGGLCGSEPVLDPDDVKLLLAMCRPWAHFRNSSLHRRMRDEEAELLATICQNTTLDLATLLSALEPWDIALRMGGEDEGYRSLVTRLGSILELRMTAASVALFKTNNGITDVVHRRAPVAYQFALFRGAAAVWIGEPRAEFLAIANESSTDWTVQDNLLQFVLTISVGLMGGFGPVDESEVRVLVSDKEVLVAAWMGATATQLQPRFIGELTKRRALLEEAMGETLPTPKWWIAVEPGAGSGREAAG